MFTQNLNLVTAVALLGWPLVALWLYRTRPIGRATLWTILGGYMWLPVGAQIKFAAIPTFDKSSIPNLAAFLGCMIVSRKSVRFWRGFGLAEILLGTLIISPFITGELNGDPIHFGTMLLPGVGMYDAGSEVVAQFVTLIPFFLGRQFLSTRFDTEEVLRVLVIAGLMYSLPILFEIRFSPQLHTWIYGYFPTGFGFEDQVRGGGFRPVVFLGHGLLVSFFICTTTIAAAAFWRTNMQVSRRTIPAIGIVGYLGIVLVLCKTVSAIIYGAALVPLVRFARPKIQVSIAVLLVSVALLYPLLRVEDLVPTNTILELATSISTDRAKSLEVRFIHEQEILDHTNERFLFGWGRYGRGWVYSDRGRLISSLDGIWIITLGTFGLIGFAALFGLLTLPVFSTALVLRFCETSREKVFLSALSLILAINIFDLLPNSSLRPWTWLLAGALLGRAETIRRAVKLSTAARRSLATTQARDPDNSGILRRP